MEKPVHACLLLLALASCGGNGTPASPSPAPTPAITPAVSSVIALSGDLAFGSVAVGSTATATLTIANNGNAPLTVSGISVVGVASVFVVGQAHATIPPGGTHAVAIQFSPVAAQPYNGTLTVNAGQASGLNTMPISGTGVPATILGATTVTFSGASSGPFSSLTESGLTVSASSSDWVVSTTYGNPAPFVQFVTAAGMRAERDVVVAGGAPFKFVSVDLYSSTTPIPYSFTGSKAGTVVFTVTGTVPNTFGMFKTIANPRSAESIDSLRIALTNAAASCCSNPMGLDNIAFAR